MGTQLKNTVAVNNLAPGAEVSVAHALNVNGLGVVPDIIYQPHPDLQVSADATDLTVRNVGGAEFSGSFLVEHWHTIERAFGDAADLNLATRPYIVVSSEGGNEPPQPPFAGEVEIFIYARTTGDDATGDGSLANPYRTFQRAIRDVPSIIPAGAIYRVDITGITEVLPANYQFPVFSGAEGLGDFDLAQEFFHYYGVVNVQADPDLVETIAAGVITHDADTTLIAVQVAPDPGWAVDQFKGMFAVCPNTPTRNSVVYANTSDTIFITRGETDPIFPIQIMEPSAHLSANLDIDGPVHETAINIKGSLVSLLGIEMHCDLGNPGNPSDTDLGLSVLGNMGPTSFQLCSLRGAQFVTSRWARIRQCYLPKLFSIGVPGLIIQSLIEDSAEPFGAGNGFISLFPVDKGGSFYMVECVCEGMTPLLFSDSIEEFRPAAVNIVVLRRCLFETPIADLFGSNDGVVVSGSQWVISSVQVNNAPGNGISFQRGGFAQISNVGGVGNGGFGIDVQDGGVAFLDDNPSGPHYPASTAPTSITGVGGDIKVGERDAAVWATLQAASPFNVVDPMANADAPGAPTGTNTGTGSRAFGTIAP